MPILCPQLLARLPSIVTRKPGMEVALALSPGPDPDPVPAHTAHVGTMAQRVEERNGADHDHRIAPDILAGL